MYKSKFYNYKCKSCQVTKLILNMTKLHIQMESYINMTRENHEIQIKVVYYRLKKYKK